MRNIPWQIDLERLATLVSTLDLNVVSKKSCINHNCRTCHNTYNNALVSPIVKEPVIKQLTIVLAEGHIEPSQPEVGKIIG